MPTNTEALANQKWQLDFEAKPNSSMELLLSGSWKIENNLPRAKDALEKTQSAKEIILKLKNISQWDTGLLSFIRDIRSLAEKQSVTINLQDCSTNMQTLLNLASAVPEKASTESQEKYSWLAAVGRSGINVYEAASNVTGFIGAMAINMKMLVTRKSKFLWSDFFYFIQDCGANSLPISMVICFLIGLILAFIGALELQKFGAGIYIANLVAVGITREMSPMMIAIILSGRTGAAYAAQIGSMQVNEEVDALKTTVISPIDFLIMPRTLALVLMIPILCIYGDFVGVIGGMITGVSTLDISFTAYIQQTTSAIGMKDIIIGILKSIIFGLLIALAGCYQGLNCGRNADAVGQATTRAVVSSIVCIIVADAIFNVILNILQI